MTAEIRPKKWMQVEEQIVTPAIVAPNNGRA